MNKLFNIFLIALFVSAAYVYVTLPDVSTLETCFTTTMHKVELCSKKPTYVKLSQISPNIKNAIVISEDVSFYSHKGFDATEFKNSFVKNLKKMSFARGGSTITQQLAKNAYLNGDKTLTRKAKELILALRIEEKYSKNTILEKYLNVVEFGQGIYGIKAATEHYFQKPPALITPLEAAFLAFLLPNPQKYSVSFKNQQLTPFARGRLQDILFKMQHYKKITEGEYTYAKSQLQLMFKSIPEMEGEPSPEDYADSTEDLRDAKELENLQEESIEKLESTPEETVFPDEIPESGVYEVQ